MKNIILLLIRMANLNLYDIMYISNHINLIFYIYNFSLSKTHTYLYQPKQMSQYWFFRISSFISRYWNLLYSYTSLNISMLYCLVFTGKTYINCETLIFIKIIFLTCIFSKTSLFKGIIIVEVIKFVIQPFN